MKRRSHRLRPACCFVNKRDLAFCVRAQVGQCAVLANLGLTLDEPMGKRDRCRHENVCLIRCVAEHQALVAGTLFFSGFAINAHGDVPRLLADGAKNGARRTIETHG